MELAQDTYCAPPDPLLMADDLEHTPASGLTSAHRIHLLQELIGTPHSHAALFPAAIRGHTHSLWQRHVAPLFQDEWPDGIADMAKLRFLSCNLYASAPYTILACSHKAPTWMRAIIRGADLLRLKSDGLHKTAALSLRLFAQTFSQMEHRRIILIATFIATIDHAFDHYMHHLPPQERERRIKGLLAGTWTPDHGSLRLTRALQLAMSEGIGPEDWPVFQSALDRVVEWCESEVAGMTGVEDPTGLDHRLAGVEGTIDGLIFPVLTYAGERARQWMYDVSLFTQMMDDWIDYDQDLLDLRRTPVISGRWNLHEISRQWHTTLDGITELAKRAGMGSPRYQAFIRQVYSYMMHDVMRAMIDGVAA